jgi:hypothetical protein
MMMPLNFSFEQLPKSPLQAPEVTSYEYIATTGHYHWPVGEVDEVSSVL